MTAFQKIWLLIWLLSIVIIFLIFFLSNPLNDFLFIVLAVLINVFIIGFFSSPFEFIRKFISQKPLLVSITSLARKLNKKIIIIIFLLISIFLLVFLLQPKDIERDTATKIYNELYKMQHEGASQREQQVYWENLISKGILTKNVQKIIYEMAAEKKQKDFLSK